MGPRWADRPGQNRLWVRFGFGLWASGSLVQDELPRLAGLAPFLEIRQQARIREVHLVGMLSIVVRDVMELLDEGGVVDLDRELTPVVEAARGEVDGTDDRPLAVG